MDGQIKWAQDFSMEWLCELLNSIEKHCSKEQSALIFDQCGACHYKRMEQRLEKYIGDLQGFIAYMAKEHGQIITYDETNNIIRVDENKDYCVCPLAKCMKDKKISPILCHCSASMTNKMLAKIIGKPVKSRVVSSVLRGDRSCVYEIEL